MPYASKDRNQEKSEVDDMGKKKSSLDFLNEEDDVIEDERDGKKGFKCSAKGFVFTGPGAKEKARAQGKEMKKKKESKES